jgi:hypothetical protein
MTLRATARQVSPVSSELLPSGLGSGKGLPRPLGDHAPLFIRHHGHDPDGQAVGAWHVSGHEINAGLLQLQQEVSIPAQAQPRWSDGLVWRMPDEHLRQEREIVYRAAIPADCVEARGQRLHALKRDQPGNRLIGEDAAEGG